MTGMANITTIYGDDWGMVYCCYIQIIGCAAWTGWKPEDTKQCWVMAMPFAAMWVWPCMFRYVQVPRHSCN